MTIPDSIGPSFGEGVTKPPLRLQASSTSCLTTETVKGAALALEGVDNVERGDSLALGVLGVGDGVTDDTLEEGLKDTTGLLVNHYKASLLAARF